MCGIAGFISYKPVAAPEAVLARMMSSIRHRGPDDSGEFVDGPASLGHRRLSIIDVAAGRQPMCNEDGRLWIVYNGEVFNHADLRAPLEAAGHRYRTRCDTETILHAFEQHGPACVKHFRGMFAFAVWDKERRRLFCARDRLGIKPFYYFWDGRLFAFASEIKALLEHPSISATLDESALPEYLAFGYLSSDQTLFSGIRRLMPGHVLTLDFSAPQPFLDIQPYWDIPEACDSGTLQDDESWIRQCREKLEETVRMRLMSDVPLGMFLSGGVDSSAIAALMKRMVSGPVKTFAVGYPQKSFSELDYAREVARHLGTEHREVVVDMDEFFNALPRLVWHEDEPLAWPSSVSLHFVSRLAAEDVKVVLTGEGSDELFGGYARYHFYDLNRKWLRGYRLLPRGLREGARGFLASSPLLSAGLRRRLQHTFLGRGESVESLYLDNFYSAFSAAEQAGLSAAAPDAPYRGFLRYWDAAAGRSPLERLLHADQKTYLAELLMKQDQMSMSASLESRVPFLDHPLVEFAARVPARLKIRGGTGKYILKRAVQDLLPDRIVYRKKMGFPTPLREWLLDPRAGALFSYLRCSDGLLAGCLEMRAINDLLEGHQGGAEDATDRIWRLLNLQLWGDIFITGKRDRCWQGLLPPRKAAASS
jgi:asparagine synthase (glutamine-hydrolysing)